MMKWNYHNNKIHINTQHLCVSDIVGNDIPGGLTFKLRGYISIFQSIDVISSLDLKVLSFSRKLQWRHKEHDGGSDHQPHDCLLKVYSGADERKHQSSASLAFVLGIHRWPVNSPHKGPITRKMFPFDDVISVYMVKKDFMSYRAYIRFPLMVIFHLQTIICWKAVRFMFQQPLSYPADIRTYIYI